MKENHSSPKPSADIPEQRNIGDYFFIFLERFWIILVCLAAAGAFAQYQLLSTPKTYEAKATIEIKRNLEAAGDISDSTSPWTAYTDMAATVSQKLNLDSLFYSVTAQPEFSALLPAPGDVTPEAYEAARRSLATAMNQATDVTFRPRSPLLEIECTHTNPQVARNIIAGMLAEYELLGTSQRDGESSANLEFLTKEIERIRENMKQGEEALVTYKEALDLRDQIRDSEARIRDMEKVYLAKWPPLVQEKAHLASLHRAFDEELARITESSGEEAAFWEAQSAQLASLSGTELINSRIRTAETRNNLLNRDFQTESDLYESLLAQMKRGDVESDFKQSEINILQPPVVPREPVGPVAAKFYVRYGILGLGVGFLIAFFLGIMDTTLRRVEEVENISNLPVFAAIPKSGKLKKRGGIDHGVPCNEAFRKFHTGLMLKIPDAKTILVSSATPGEGKSTVAWNLAATAAAWGWGERVLLLDLDLRRPQIENYLPGKKKELGVMDCLQRTCKIEDAVRPHPELPELHVLGAGFRRFQHGLPDSKALTDMLELLKSKYDRIIIDSAPILAVNDTMVIARHVEEVCLTFRMWKTPRKAFVRALNQLADDETYPIGVVCNFMPQRKGFGRYGYYHSYTGSEGYGSELGGGKALARL